MTRSPNRTHTNYVYALIEDMPNISKDNLTKIEQEGFCKLGNKLSDELIKILKSFTENEAIERHRPTRGELYEYLEKKSEAASILNGIFGDQQNHAKRVCTSKIDDEFEQTIADVGFELSARWDLIPKYYSSDLNLTQDDHIDFEYLADNCLMISHAAKRAIKKMDHEIIEDAGGRNKEDLKNKLLLALQSIYNKATGKKNALERFILACVACIPNLTDQTFPQSREALCSN